MPRATLDASQGKRDCQMAQSNFAVEAQGQFQELPGREFGVIRLSCSEWPHVPMILDRKCTLWVIQH